VPAKLTASPVVVITLLPPLISTASLYVCVPSEEILLAITVVPVALVTKFLIPVIAALIVVVPAPLFIVKSSLFP
jgi:hypothetical protein